MLLKNSKWSFAQESKVMLTKALRTRKELTSGGIAAQYLIHRSYV